MTRRGQSASVGCEREPAVLAAILGGRWPDACGEELTMHVERCECCGEVATVASLLRDDHEAGGRDAHVPAAGQVWWRAAVRARLEAAQSAARPITWVHGISGASAAGLAVAVMGTVWPSIMEGVEWAGERLTTFDPETLRVAGVVADVVQRSLPFAIGIAACLVLAPIALYLALTDD